MALEHPNHVLDLPRQSQRDCKGHTKLRNGFWLVASKEEKADGHQAFRRGSFFDALSQNTFFAATKERITLCPVGFDH